MKQTTQLISSKTGNILVVNQLNSSEIQHILYKTGNIRRGQKSANEYLKEKCYASFHIINIKVINLLNEVEQSIVSPADIRGRMFLFQSQYITVSQFIYMKFPFLVHNYH